MGGKLSKKKKGYDVSDPKDLKDEITAKAVGAVEAVQAAVESALPAEAAGMTAEVGKKASAAVEEVVGSTLEEITQAVGGALGMGDSKEEPKDEPAPAQKDPEKPAAPESAALEPAPVLEKSVEEPAPVEKDPEPAVEEQVAIKPVAVETPTAEEVVAVEPAAVEPVVLEPTPVPEIFLEGSSPVKKDPEPAAEEQEAIKHVAGETPTADEVVEVEPAAVEPELPENDPEPAIVDAAAVKAPAAVEQVAIEPFAEEPAVEEPAPVQKNQELTPEEATEVAEGGTPDNAPAQTQEAPVVLEAPMVEPSALSSIEISPVEQPEPKPDESLEDEYHQAPEPDLEKPEAYTEISEAPSATIETAPETVTEPNVAELQSEPSTNLEVVTEPQAGAEAVEEQGIAEVKQEAAAPEVSSTKPEPATEETLTEVSPEPEAPEPIAEVAAVSMVPVEEDEFVEASAVQEVIPEPQVETMMENGDTNSQSAREEEKEEALDSLPVVNGGCSDSSDLSEEQVNGTETEPQVKATTELRELEVTKDLTLNAHDDVSEMVKSLSAADNQAVELV